MLRTRQQPLHPIAWWCWAGALAVAASRTTNPLLLGLILAVVAWVVTTRRGNTPWARSFGALLRLGLVVIFIRVVVQVLFGDRVPGTTWFSLPSVPLPSWAAGVTIGGPVTAQAAIGAFCQGLQIAVILACFGAANSLASSFRLLRCVPAGLYEVAVAVTVAISFTPQVVLSIARVRDARRLRGRPTSGLRDGAAWQCRSSTARSSVLLLWRRPWTPAASGAASVRRSVAGDRRGHSRRPGRTRHRPVRGARFRLRLGNRARDHRSRRRPRRRWDGRRLRTAREAATGPTVGWSPSGSSWLTGLVAVAGVVAAGRRDPARSCSRSTPWACRQSLSPRWPASSPRLCRRRSRRRTDADARSCKRP